MSLQRDSISLRRVSVQRRDSRESILSLKRDSRESLKRDSRESLKRDSISLRRVSVQRRDSKGESIESAERLHLSKESLCTERETLGRVSSNLSKERLYLSRESLCTEKKL